MRGGEPPVYSHCAFTHTDVRCYVLCIISCVTKWGGMLKRLILPTVGLAQDANGAQLDLQRYDRPGFKCNALGKSGR